jgi:hypothetical protein
MAGIKDSLGIKSGDGTGGKRDRNPDGSLGRPTNAFPKGVSGNPEGKGRIPKVFENSVRTKFLEGLRLGLPYQKIAQICHVQVGTMRNWMLYAEKQFSSWYDTWEDMGFDETVELPFWVQLFVDIREAEADGEQVCLRAVRDAAVGQQQTTEFTKSMDSKGNTVYEKETTKTHKPDIRAATWLLERRYPERYGRKRADGDEIPKGLDYETIMLAKVLKTIPRSDLEEIKELVKRKMRPELTDGDEELGNDTE